MFLEVLIVVCLLLTPDGAKVTPTASTGGNIDGKSNAKTPGISYIAKENRARKVSGNPGASCGLEQNPIHGSSECLIACLTQSQKLHGFGWNKNSSECRCCNQPTGTNSNKVDGEGWETYLPGCLDTFSTVFRGETPRCFYLYHQRREMSYSDAMLDCQRIGGELVKSTSTTDLKWMKGVVNLIGDMDSGVFFEVVEDDAIKPFVCERSPAFELWN